MFLAQHFREHVVIAAVVITHTIVFSQTGNKGAKAYTLVVIETTAVCVLIKEQDSLRIFLTGCHEVLVGLQFGQRVCIEMIDTSAPTDSEETAIFVRHLHEVGKQIPTTRLRHRAQVASVTESPELLGIVPTEEVGEGFEEILEGLEVVVLNMGVSARCRLAAEPHIVLLTHRSPRLIGTHSITRHTIHACGRIELTR